MSIQDAFDKVCSEAKPAKGWYVVLMEYVPYYGGPEEGGWWGMDSYIRAYQYFPTEEQATRAKRAVDKLARELKAESRKAFGEKCLAEMEWCDQRGLDADYLGEVDGESSWEVLLCAEMPTESRGPRYYS